MFAATNITAPLPPDFITTGDAEGEISGFREGNEMNTLIRGTFNARRSVYTKDIDVADIVSGRNGGGSLSAGSDGSSSSFLGVPKLDIRIEGRDALVVRNNLADLTASASLRVTGDTEFPQISGRITANSGTIFFRKTATKFSAARCRISAEYDASNRISICKPKPRSKVIRSSSVLSEISPIPKSLNATVRSNPAIAAA